MKIYLIAPKNPNRSGPSTAILPSLGKRCVFPNLSLPTVAGLTPPRHEVVLCDENVEPIDFDTDAEIVGHHRLRVPQAAHVRARRRLPAPREARRGGRPACHAVPGGAARQGGRRSSWARPSTPGRVSVRDYDAGDVAGRVPPGREANMPDSPAAALRRPEEVLRTMASSSRAAARSTASSATSSSCTAASRGPSRRRRSCRDRGRSTRSASARSSSPTTTSSATRRTPRSCSGGRRLARGTRLPDGVLHPGEHRHGPGRGVARPAARGQLLAVFLGIESPRKASLEETQKTQNMREDIARPRSTTSSRRLGHGRHDRRLRQRRPVHLRGAVPVYPGGADPDLDDRAC